ncbi:MAG TPA: hypothetical protein VGM27_19060 [Acidobacteriaceae bacterium]|jgi:hypothetical protein
MPIAKEANRPTDPGKVAETGIHPATQWPYWETDQGVASDATKHDRHRCGSRQDRSALQDKMYLRPATIRSVPLKNADVMLIGIERPKQGTALCTRLRDQRCIGFSIPILSA